MALGSLFTLSSGVPASLHRERSWPEDTYLTDGERLFRVISPLSEGSRRGVAMLEDCRSLALALYTGEELWHMALKPVARYS